MFAAVALAGLGDLPDTLMSRSVVIRMRRRAPHEHVVPFRRRLAVSEGERLRDRLADWSATVADLVTDAWPDMPEGVTDRPADVWEPLLAVADAAGGEWPGRARDACVELCRASVSRDASLGVRLLADLRTVFGELIMALRLNERRLRTDGYHQLPPLLRQLQEALVARAGQERTTSDGEALPDEDGRVLLLDYDAVGAQLGVSERTVRRLVETGDLRVVRIGQSPRVHPDDLRAFVETLRQQRSA